MSRHVVYKGRIFPRVLFEPQRERSERRTNKSTSGPSGPSDPQPCPLCDDLGVVPEQIDDDRLDVMVPCEKCRMYCRTCGKYVRRAGHENVHYEADNSETDKGTPTI